MKQFSILYFRESVLDRAEQISAIDVLEAIESATYKSPDEAVEVWSGGKRVAEVGTSPAANGPGGLAALRLVYNSERRQDR